MTVRATARPAVKLVVMLGLFGLWALVFRPQWMGGSNAYVMVRGDSMLPTYRDGDLVVISLQADYDVGDVVGYLIPPGEVGAGQLVVHRVAAVEPDGGFVIRGDNNDLPDPWTPSATDIRGQVVLSVPGLGKVIATALKPANAAALAAALVVMALVAGSPRQPQVARVGSASALRLGALNRRRSAAR